MPRHREQAETYDKAFTLHMSQRQHRALREAAKDRGTSIGAVLRDLIETLEEKK